MTTHTLCQHHFTELQNKAYSPLWPDLFTGIIYLVESEDRDETALGPGGGVSGGVSFLSVTPALIVVTWWIHHL